MVHAGGPRADAAEGGRGRLSVYEGVPWRDVDEPADLARLREELDACPDLAPRTAGVLRML